MVVPMKAIKKLQKDGIIWPIKHDFAWHIIYEQHVANVSVRIFRKENIKIFMKIWLVKFIWQEMWILHVNFLIKHFKTIDKHLYFMPNLIQIIINIVTLGCQIYTWNYATHLSKNSFNSSMIMIVQNGILRHLPLSKYVATKTPFK
jgi:hypothetical protein